MIAVLLLPHSGKATIQLKNYAKIRSDEYGIDYDKFEKLIACESNWIHFTPKGNMLIGDHGKAKGLLQFWHTTFSKYAYLFEEVFEREADYTNPYDQIDLSLLMLADDQENWRHWSNCSIKNKVYNYAKINKSLFAEN